MGTLLLALSGWGVLAALFLLLYLYERIVRDASIVDVGWSGSIGLLAFGYAVLSDAPLERRILIGSMGVLWSLRLTVYLFFNRVYGKEEDGRYQNLRRNWGDRSGLFFFLFFQAQALLGLVFSIPFLLALTNTAASLSFFEWISIPVWVTAVLGETYSDLQLARFRSNASNRGRVCQEGLWRYSRHPNYFFEWLHWWTYVIVGIGHWWGWINLLFPLTMTFFLFKLTGIPATEEQALKSRGEAYREYQRTTNRFFPWFPREHAS
ncbi:MAG: DUF1295 domain-containing protein [Candidatus Omnitrophica bacterium]|nr:DUF1295 domain-containing protein [Candidatus Omnitrophota bacterium]